MKNKEEIFVTNSFEETQCLGENFVVRSLLHEGDSLSNTIALYGNLGSGKTTFVQGMARGLGIKRRIISPTFIIVRSYQININNLLFELVENYQAENFSTRPSSDGLRSKNKLLNLKNFYHIDLYRIKNDKDIKGLGIEEIISNPRNIVAIEWAEKMGSLLSRKRWDVEFEYAGENSRKIIARRLL